MRIVVLLLVLLTFACQQKNQKSDGFKFDEKVVAEESGKASLRVDLTSKGIGEITEVEFSDSIDTQLAESGQQIFEGQCIACHQLDKTYIGPSPVGILSGVHRMDYEYDP